MDNPAAERTRLMKRAFLASIVAALALAFVAPTTAQAQKTDKQKVKTYDFSGDNIDGDLVKPDGVQIDTRTFASHTSLIRIRKDFIKEILKSAEDL
jgi:predicted secreted Zn-dependent protease